MKKVSFSISLPKVHLDAKQVHWIALTVAMALMFLSSGASFAQASGPSFNVLDGIRDTYVGKQGQWGDVVRVFANRLFWLLAVIDFCYLCLTFMLDKKEMDDMMFSVIRKLMTLGFFFFLLKSSNTWIGQILDSFVLIGKKAGKTEVASPDGIAAAGFDAAAGVFQILHELNLGEQMVAVLPATIMGLLIFLAFLWVAAQLLVCQVETALAVGAGIILLGFGGSKWTTDMASKYMQYAVATGLKLMLLFLIVGVGQNMFADMKLVSGSEFFLSLLKSAGAAIMYAFLATKIPAIASAMMSGSPSLTAGDMMGAVLGAGAAIAGLAAAGAVGGKAAAGAGAGAAANATGVARALGAGIESGLDHGKSGAGLAAHAIGEAASHGLGLASGALGDKVAEGRAAFGSMVDQSAGGKVATSIQASRGGSMAGVSAPGGSDPAANGSRSSTQTTGYTPAGASAMAAGADSATGGAVPASQASAGTDVVASSADQTNVRGAAAAGDAAPASSASAPASSASAPASSASAPASSASAPASSALAPASSALAPASSASAPASSALAPASSALAPASSALAPASSASAPASSASAPASSASAPTSSTSAPASSASAPTSSASAPAGGAAAPSAGSEWAAPGDASSGAVSGGNGTKGAENPYDRRPPPMHERIQGMKGYLPEDAAHAATVNIDLKHTE
jgi:type IV secretion system protein TrbL